MSKKDSFIELYESLPMILKVVIQVVLGLIVGGIYRIILFLENKNTTTLVIGILALIPPIDVVFWIIDLYSQIKHGRITYLLG